MSDPVLFVPALRVGIDRAGPGIVLGPGATQVRVLGAPAALGGDLVADHGDSPHDSAVLIGAASRVRIEGQLGARALEFASCGDPQFSTQNKVMHNG